MYSAIGILGILAIIGLLYAILTSSYAKQIIFILGVYVVIHAIIMWNKAELDDKSKDKK